MKVLFAYDIRFLKDNKGNIYSDAGYNSNIWNRYKEAFGDLTIMSRLHETDMSDYELLKGYTLLPPEIKHVEIFDCYKNVFSFLNVFARLKNKSIIREAVKKSDITVSRLPSWIGNTALNEVKKYKKSCLIEVVGCPWDSLWNRGVCGKILAPIMWLRTRRNVRKANYTLYVSQFFLQKRYPSNGLSFNCSDVELKRSDINTLKERLKKIDRIKDQIVIGSIGAIDVKYKGHKYVIKALAKLKKEGYNFKYRIVGGGKKDELEKTAKTYKVQDEVEFCGVLSHDEIFNYLNSIDIYIQPSLTEGLPRAVIEAMSCACPVMGSRVGGMPELVNEEFLFNKKNVNEIKNKIIKLSQKQNLKREAERSFNSALDYEKETLDNRRKNFYELIKREINCYD